MTGAGDPVWPGEELSGWTALQDRILPAIRD